MSTGIAIGSSSAAPAAAAPAAAPAAPAANTGTTTSAAAPQAAAPATPPIPGNAQGCVGFAVSTSAHFTRSLGEGFGDFFKDNAVGTPGAAIQSFAASNCGKH
jgi:hypothetical protein